MKNNYEDIINLEHHVSKKHPQMSMESRAAQFAPFAALTGYGEAVYETARLTEEKIEIDEGIKQILNKKLQKIKAKIKQNPIVIFTYFEPDKKKQGGRYVNLKGSVKNIDEYNQIIILTNEMKIPIGDISNIRIIR